ncbi:MAG: TIGR01906 family membrane protein [Clostridium sp.]|nr:TIGR01906 family membrane protein [Clostridium sp.]
MNKIFRFALKIFLGILGALFIIGISTIIGLNSKFIYYYAIDKYNLSKVVNIPKEVIIKDFNTLIEYLQNIFIEKLSFINFPMSSNGEYHFYEVKMIFISIYIIVITILIFFIVIYIINKKKNNSLDLINILNYGVNTLIGVILALTIAISVNFSKIFEVFHKVFFNNDYWIFDAKTDPIINILPEEVFKLYAIYIIIIAGLFILIIKTFYYMKQKKVKEKIANSISV